MKNTGKSSSPAKSIWYAIGGAALVAVIAGVLSAIPDIKRYLKIRSM